MVWRPVPPPLTLATLEGRARSCFDARVRTPASVLRWVACAVAMLAVFGPLLAALGARGNGDARVVLSAALSAALALLLRRCRDGVGVVGVSVLGFFALSLVTWRLGAPLLSNPRGHGGVVDVSDWLGEPMLHALLLAPVALAMHRGAVHDSDDARDRLMLAASASCLASLAETALYIATVRARRGSYDGMAAVALGPTLLGLLTLSSVLALGALVRSARWMRLWRRALSSGDFVIVPKASWTAAAPERPWMRLLGVENDGVLLRRTAREASAYRAGDVDQAISRVPLDSGRVLTALWLRVAASLALLASSALLAVTRLSALRW